MKASLLYALLLLSLTTSIPAQEEGVWGETRQTMACG